MVCLTYLVLLLYLVKRSADYIAALQCKSGQTEVTCVLQILQIWSLLIIACRNIHKKIFKSVLPIWMTKTIKYKWSGPSWIRQAIVVAAISYWPCHHLSSRPTLDIECSFWVQNCANCYLVSVVDNTVSYSLMGLSCSVLSVVIWRTFQFAR